MGFGNYLKEALKERGKTVYWLSNQTGIPKTTLYGMIKRDGNTDFDTAIAILAALDIEIYDCINAGGFEYIDPAAEEKRFRTFKNQDSISKSMKLAIARDIVQAIESASAHPDFISCEWLYYILEGLTAQELVKVFDYAAFVRSEHENGDDTND